VYQGIARNLGIEEVWNINAFAIENFLPELTILVDVKPEIALARIYQNENREVNRLDLEKRDFHDLTYHGYQSLLQRFPKRIKAVDGDDTIENVSRQAIQLIEGLIHRMDELQ
jgi:dTMP kinase